MDDTRLKEPQQPSAMERLASDPSDRKRFLKAVGGTGAAGAFALFLAACGGDDKKSSSGSTSTQQTTSGGKTGTEMFGKGDMGILGYALTLEYLEAQFYADAAKSGKLKKGPVLDVAKAFGEHEAEHVAALEATIKKLGGKLPDKPKAKFPLESEKAILELAATVEDLGAAAYLGQAGNIQDMEVLAAALSIHSVEARHAAVLNQVTGRPIAPDGAFAKPADAAMVLETVKPFLAS